MTAPKIKIGDRFNKLIVLERKENTTGGKAQWLVRCDCEDRNELIVPSNQLTSGGTKSCGCLVRDRNKGKDISTGNPLYSRWSGMIQRCLNSNSTNYEYYGGRGIGVYHEWLSDFKKFKSYMEEIHPDYLELLSLKYQIDRINPDGNYEPGNIRLVPASVNAKNRRPQQGPTLSRYVPIITKKNVKDITNQVFGHLTAIEPVGSSSRGVLWKCVCSCSKEAVVPVVDLTTGRIKSCGHLKSVSPTKTHGLRNDPAYAVWARLRDRAKKGKIQIIEEWLDFPTFHAWIKTQDWGNGRLLRTKVKGEVYGPETCYFKPFA